jgi:hypothetical protein
LSAIASCREDIVMLRMECRMAALLVAMLAAPVWAQDDLTGGTASQTAAGGDCCVPACYRDPGLIVFADYLNWKARSDSLEFVERSIYGDTTSTTEADYVSLPQQSGIRAGLGYRFASQWDVAWIYTYYFTSGQNAANAAPGVYLTVPASPFGPYYSVTSVVALTKLRYNVNDLEIGRWISLDDHVDLRPFGGFRYAVTESSGHEDFTNAWEQTLTDIHSKMDAYGIRLGGEGRWRIGNGNLSLFGRGAGSVLAGRFENVGTIGPTRDYYGTRVYRHNDTHAVCVMEAAAGVAYQYGNWELRHCKTINYRNCH